MYHTTASCIPITPTILTDPASRNRLLLRRAPTRIKHACIFRQHRFAAVGELDLRRDYRTRYQRLAAQPQPVADHSSQMSEKSTATPWSRFCSSSRTRTSRCSALPVRRWETWPSTVGRHLHLPENTADSSQRRTRLPLSHWGALRHSSSR